MERHNFKLGPRGLAVLAIAAAFPLAGRAAPAARVDFAIGSPTAQSANGTVRPLAKGAEVGQGDTINTGEGRVQLRFVDGAYVSLQPQSQFRIDEFRFNGQQDGSERGFFSLLKGGLRTITGLVGRTNKNNYQVTTTVATIGIRGTEYTIQYGKSVSGSVGEGEIKVCNGGGCLNVQNGESYYVQNADVRPQITDKKVDLPVTQPQTTTTSYVQSENRDASGDPLSFILTGKQTVNAALVKPFGSPSAGTSTWEFDAAGSVRTMDTCFSGCTESWTLDIPSGGQPPVSGNDGIIAWGRWNGGVTVPGGEDYTGNKSLHYVGGLPVGGSMPTAVSGTLIGTYQVIGATTPTSSDGSFVASFAGASLMADFGPARSVLASVSVAFGGTTHTQSALGTISGEQFYGGVGGSSGAITGLSFEGFFAGANARRAGMTYELTAAGSSVHGALAFTQTGLQPGGTALGTVAAGMQAQ